MRKSYTNVKRRIRVVAFAAVAGLLALPNLASAQPAEGQQDEVFQKTRDVTIPGNNLVSFDISWFEGSLNRYYLGDRSNKSVDVVIPPNTTTDKQFMPGFVGARGIDSVTGNVCGPPTGGTCVASNDVSGPDGVMVIDNAGTKQLWVGDGDSRVWVLDPITGLKLTLAGGATNPIPTSSNNHRRADELCFDSADGLVMVANNADDPPFASIISTTTYTVVGKIVFDGTKGAPKSTNGAEQCQWSPRTGMFYINVPGINTPDDGTGVTVEVNPKIVKGGNVGKVVAVFDIDVGDCAAPQGMALGPAPQIFLGCNAPSPDGHSNTVVINEISGSTIGKLPDQGGNDEVWFNPGDGHYLGAGGQTQPTERLIVVDSTGKRPDESVKTGTNCNTTRRAHSVAADPNTNEVYVPIPATTGTVVPDCPTGAAYFTSDLCTTPTKGCVAVFKPVGINDKSSSVGTDGPSSSVGTNGVSSSVGTNGMSSSVGTNGASSSVGTNNMSSPVVQSSSVPSEPPVRVRRSVEENEM
jgi:hypothetical protein